MRACLCLKEEDLRAVNHDEAEGSERSRRWDVVGSRAALFLEASVGDLPANQSALGLEQGLI